MIDVILLAVDETTADLTPDGRVLAAALRDVGVRPVAHRWGEPVPNGATVLVRSTWDYIERPEQFIQWLDHLDEQRAIVHNPTSLLRWNVHKGYLLELDRAGVPIVPTVLLAAGSSPRLEHVLAEHDWSDAVIKPAIGGTARLTRHLARVGAPAAQAHLETVIGTEDVIVQPYVTSICDVGEISVVVIDGGAVSAIAKRPADGDWRVQSDFGGSAHLIELSVELISAAAAVLAAVSRTPTVARVDLVRTDDGNLALLELELIEPELFFRLEPAAARRLVDCLLR